MIAALHGLMHPNSTPFLVDKLGAVFAAVSFRKLRKNYLGPACRVRRASDNAEMDIPIVNGYADTALFTSFVGASTAYLSIWYEQTVGMNETAPTLAEQPLLVLNAAGKLVARFGGTHFMRTVTRSLPDTTKGSLITASATITSANNAIIAGFGQFTTRRLRGNYINNSLHYSVGGGDPSNISTGVSYATSTSFTSTWEVLPDNTTGNIKGYVNGQIRANGTAVPLEPVALGQLQIGDIFEAGTKRAPFSGDIFEVIQTNTLLSESTANTIIAPDHKAFYNLY